MSAWRRLWRSDDSGASLVFALIFITIISVVVAAILTLAETSVRSTIRLRGEAGEAAAAEGAANIAINALRESTYVGTGGCFGATSQLSIPSAEIPGPDTMSARVTCTPDASLSTAPYVAPAQSLLTIHGGAAVGGPTGILLAPTSSSSGLRIAGSVHSNSTIVVPLGNLTATGAGTTIRARRACTTFPLGSISPSPSCNTGTVLPTPSYTLPPVTGLPTRSVPPCAPIMTFQPGRYTDVAALSQRTSALCQGGNAILHFPGGVYRFEFANLLVPWFVTAGTVIAGDLAPGVSLTAGSPPAVPGSCHSPMPLGSGWTAPLPDDGVLFHFTGESGLSVSAAGRMEICGRYGGTSPSVAMTADAHTGALAGTCDSTTFPCSALWGTAPAALQVNGTLYLPNREVVLTLSNSSAQSFKGGVIARRIWVTTSKTTTTPVIQVPTGSPSLRQTVVNLSVFLCPGSATCTGGNLRLAGRVSIVDPSGIPAAGARQMSVLGWSVRQ